MVHRHIVDNRYSRWHAGWVCRKTVDVEQGAAQLAVEWLTVRGDNEGTLQGRHKTIGADRFWPSC